MFLQKKNYAKALLELSYIFYNTEEIKIKKKINTILYGEKNNDNTNYHWFIKVIINSQWEKLNKKLSQITILLLIFNRNNIYSPLTWQYIYDSLLIQKNLSNEIVKIGIHLGFSVILLFVLLFLKIFLMNGSLITHGIPILLINGFTILIAIIAFQNLRKKFLQNISYSYFIIFLFDNYFLEIRKKNLILLKIFEKLPNYKKIIQKKTNGESLQDFIKYFPEDFIIMIPSNNQELKIIIMQHIKIQLEKYKNQINYYTSLFFQIFLIVIITMALFIVFDSSSNLRYQYKF